MFTFDNPATFSHGIAPQGALLTCTRVLYNHRTQQLALLQGPVVSLYAQHSDYATGALLAYGEPVELTRQHVFGVAPLRGRQVLLASTCPEAAFNALTGRCTFTSYPGLGKHQLAQNPVALDGLRLRGQEYRTEAELTALFENADNADDLRFFGWAVNSIIGDTFSTRADRKVHVYRLSDGWVESAPGTDYVKLLDVFYTSYAVRHTVFECSDEVYDTFGEFDMDLGRPLTVGQYKQLEALKARTPEPEYEG